MKTTLTTFVLSLIFIAAANARLGETYDECVNRYGPLREKKGDAINPQFMFQKDGIIVGINFLNGKAAQLSFRKHDFFLDSDVQKLLDVNSGGSKWKFDAVETQRQLAPDIYNKQEYFTREDGGAVAEYLVLQTRVEFVKIVSTEYKKAISAKQLQGF